jgi:hypothetical protein
MKGGNILMGPDRMLGSLQPEGHGRETDEVTKVCDPT